MGTNTAVARSGGNNKNAAVTTRTSKHKKEELVDKLVGKEDQHILIDEHLPPLSLTCIILFCSGALLIYSLRDFLATGKNIGGTWDEAMLLFTKSTDWFDDSKGWKSTQGGFSAISKVSTDENNMGGFFIRKLTGGAGCAVQLHKIIPFLFHENNAQWSLGHFHPLLYTAIFSNIVTMIFYAFYYDDLSAAGAWDLPAAMIVTLIFETIAIACFLLFNKTKRGPAVALPKDKTHTSPVSNIVTRTVLIVTSAIAIIAIRDLFFPGIIIDIIPRDDIYLEWTNAFYHSPPNNTPEEIEQGLLSTLYIGDKFISQLCSLYILILCIYKYISTIYIRYGSDGSGIMKSKMIWKVSFIGDAALLVTYRFFVHAASTASFDIRWHLILLSYETFILALYGYF